MKKIKEKPANTLWAGFQENTGVTDEQLEKFVKYADLLQFWNQKTNLTAIRDLSGIIRQHFQDSLALTKFYDLNDIKTLADIGPGAGFPAIPLKILFPHLKIYLIEVNNKKQKFLDFLISELGLQDIIIADIDWRTFLRKTNLDIDLFVTRAALADLELSRMFKPGCFYKNSTLVYWGSLDWEAHKKVEPLVSKIKDYRLGKKDRKLVFMKLPK